MRNGYFGILRSIAIMVMIVLGFNMLGGIILVAFYGINIQGAGAGMIVAINALAQLAVMFTVPILIVKNFEQDSQASFRLEGINETPLAAMLLGVPMVLLAQVIGGALDGLWISFLKLFPIIYDPLFTLQKYLDDFMSSVTSATSFGELIILLIGISLIPAIAEETLFRGFIQTNIERSGKTKTRPYIAIVITSILFAAVHASPLNFPGLLSIGLVLGWLAYRTSDLRVSMLAHAINNGLIVLAMFFFKGSTSALDSITGTPEVSVNDSLILLAVSLPFVIGSFYLFQKITEPLRARHNAEYELARIKDFHHHESETTTL